MIWREETTKHFLFEYTSQNSSDIKNGQGKVNFDTNLQ